MKCHEFLEAVESLTPSQLLERTSGDGAFSGHAAACPACGEWLASQRMLQGGLQSLRARTAGQQAPPAVEQALLQAFREQDFAPVLPFAPERAAPAAWKLSRYFEAGAYVAVAAALLVGVFLGSRVLLHPRPGPAVARTVPAVLAPQTLTLSPNAAGTVAPLPATTAEVAKAAINHPKARAGARDSQLQTASSEADKSSDNSDYVSLMLCDPLICSGDEQVIRMELPVNGTSAPVMADVVVGDDGLVRAMRIVNQ